MVGFIDEGNVYFSSITSNVLIDSKKILQSVVQFNLCQLTDSLLYILPLKQSIIINFMISNI
jgi:hypothetical protein